MAQSLQPVTVYIKAREKYFQRVQLCYDLISKPNQLSTFLQRCKLLDDTFVKFEAVNEQIEVLNAAVDEKERVDTLKVTKAFEELFFQAKAYEARIIEDKTAEAANASTHHETPRVKLPTITVPVFDGNITDFPSWKSLFDELVHIPEHLSSIQKFSYLKTYLKGSALLSIDTIAFTSANYPLAYKTLVDRYSKKRALASHFMNKLLDFQSLSKDSGVSLRTFLDHFHIVVESIRSLGIVNLEDFILLHLGLRVLDPKTTLEFEQDAKDKEFPTFSDLVNFVKNKVNILELNAESSTKPKSIPSKMLMTNVQPEYSTPDTPTLKHLKCSVCQHNFHKLSFCSKFKALPPNQRFEIVKNLKLCFGCFSATHSSTECTSKFSCQTTLSSVMMTSPSYSTTDSSPASSPPSPALSSSFNSPSTITASVPSTNNILQHLISSYPKKLSIFHLNAHSIRPPVKYIEIKEIFAGTPADIICITESWLDSSISNAEVSLQGYNLIRNDRLGKRGGGVAIYLNNAFSYKILSSSPSNYSASPEYLIIEVTISSSKIMLAVVYHPPKTGPLDDFFDAIESHLPNYNHRVVCGDFNCDLSITNSRSAQLRSLFSDLNLHILPLLPTHHTATSHTLLDLLVVGDEDSVITHGQLPVGSSHHELIYLILNIFPPKHQPKFITARDFRRFDSEKFSSAALAADWNSVYSSSDVDSKLSRFNEIVLSLFDEFAPFRTFKAKHHSQPWFNNDIREHIRIRDRAKRRYARSGSSAHLNLYHETRNKVNQMIRNAKQRHAYTLFPANLPIKDFYRNVKKLLPQDKDSDILLDTNDLVEAFSSAPQPPNYIVDSTTSHYTSLSPPSIPSLEFHELTLSEVCKFLKKGNPSSMGYDQIPLNYITRMLDIISPVILHIFNQSISSNTFPSIWKRALIRPIPKVKNPTSASDYRPISLLCSLSKVLERLVHNQVMSHIGQHNLLNPFQSGFRSGHSTCSALLKVTDDIQFALDKKRHPYWFSSTLARHLI
ncbi:hypothetical protein M8J77_021503 [Diaphorina citri]|nr:hypothetical protein M8J77_021503 [Diaphorina citri]